MKFLAICICIPILFIVCANTSAAIVSFTLKEIQLLDCENKGSIMDGIYSFVILSHIEMLYIVDSSISLGSTPLSEVRKDAYIIGHSIIEPTNIGEVEEGTHINAISNIEMVGIAFNIFIIGLNIYSNIGMI